MLPLFIFFLFSFFIFFLISSFQVIFPLFAGRDSIVTLATRYWLDDTGIESREGERFSASVQTGPAAHPASYTMGTGSLSRH
jgi:hypothetical protein